MKKSQTDVKVEHLQAALQQIIIQCGAVLTALDSLDPKLKKTLRFFVMGERQIPISDDVFCPKVVFCPKPIAVKQECWMPAPEDWAERLKRPKAKVARKKKRKTK